ncbi:MAG: SDR family oxidoreductase [Deltaproteobacteria bacterium]|nr:SDR family oxidoreductase [Deltaproteobacteria bacterium]
MSFFLVTGGAGFIGSNLVEALLMRGEKVRVVDNFSTGKKENLIPFLSDIELIEGDIADPSISKKAVKGVEYILHEAALGSVARSVDDPIATNRANIDGTLNLLIAAKDENIQRFVLAASSSCYGDSEELPKREDMPVNPLSPYAVTKLTQEHYCKVFYHIYGLPTVILRYFNVYGPRQDPNSIYSAVVPIFISRLLKGERPTIFGDGEQSRDFTFVEDVVNANILACKTPNIEGEIFNIAYGQRITINKLFGIIRKRINSNLEPIYGDKRPGEVRHSLADISKAKKLMGYKSRFSIEDGISKTIEYFIKKFN